MSLENLIRQLENGICPAELCYRADAQEEFDIEKIAYNTRYNSFEFFDQKFPNEIKRMPGYEKIVDLCVQKNKGNSPLKEITRLTEEKNIDKLYKGDEASER
ncbi:MAG: hypothetical protein ACO3UU_07995 [Minisyncoccia bacterium]